MRNIDEIRGSIKDLILKAENEELLNIQNKESQNLSNESENSETQLSDEILKQINLEVTEFQKAFKENGSKELISQTIRETIKPILHEWLKINLPVIVKEVIDEKINEIQNLPSVKAAWGEVLGFAQFIKIVDGETVLISNGFAPTFGAAWDTNPYAQQWSLVEGEPPTNTKEVVMDIVTAENHEFSVGDRVTVLAGATPASFTIVGIAEFANVGAPGGATFALFEFRTAQKLLDSRGEVDLINVVIENNFDINDVKNDITKLDSENLNVINAQEAAAEQADSIKQGLDFFNTILNVFAGIAIFVGAFIIQNTFRLSLIHI